METEPVVQTEDKNAKVATPATYEDALKLLQGRSASSTEAICVALVEFFNERIKKTATRAAPEDERERAVRDTIRTRSKPWMSVRTPAATTEGFKDERILRQAQS